MKESNLTDGHINVLKVMSDDEWHTIADVAKELSSSSKAVANSVISLVKSKMVDKSNKEIPAHPRISSYRINRIGLAALNYYLNKAEEPIISSVEIVDDSSFVRDLSLEFARKLRNETLLERIHAYSNASANLAKTYYYLNQLKNPIEMIDNNSLF